MQNVSQCLTTWWWTFYPKSSLSKIDKWSCHWCIWRHWTCHVSDILTSSHLSHCVEWFRPSCKSLSISHSSLSLHLSCVSYWFRRECRCWSECLWIIIWCCSFSRLSLSTVKWSTCWKQCQRESHWKYSSAHILPSWSLKWEECCITCYCSKVKDLTSWTFRWRWECSCVCWLTVSKRSWFPICSITRSSDCRSKFSLKSQILIWIWTDLKSHKMKSHCTLYLL